MTDTIENLRAEYEAKKSVAKAAADEAKKARSEMLSAMCSEKIKQFEAMGGVVGKTKVREELWGGKIDMHRGPYLVISAEPAHYGDKVVFAVAKIKKNGTASSAIPGTSPENVVILPGDNQ